MLTFAIVVLVLYLAVGLVFACMATVAVGSRRRLVASGVVFLVSLAFWPYVLRRAMAIRAARNDGGSEHA